MTPGDSEARSPEAPDLGWGRPVPSPRYVRSSPTIVTRDAVRLAADVYLPVGEGTSLATVLVQTRYFRRHALKPEWQAWEPLLTRDAEAALWVGAGYAFVSVDARGSGASDGVRTGDGDAVEVADAHDVCAWVVDQPWSDGTIGTTGISYEGSTAERTLLAGHPAVRAVISRNCLWEGLADVMAPGGIRHAWFVDRWGGLCTALDSNEVEAYFTAVGAGGVRGLLALAGAGVARRDDDPTGELLQQAIAQRKASYSLREATRAVEYADDLPGPNGSLSALAHASTAEQLQGTGVPVLALTGWHDGAFAEAAVKRWRALAAQGSQLVIGPWDHSNRFQTEPTATTALTSFDHFGLMRRFFDRHVRGIDNGADTDPAVRYYTLIERRWKSASSWPPRAAPLLLHLAPDGHLAAAPPAAATGTYVVDFSCTTGSTGRWNTQVNYSGALLAWPELGGADSGRLAYVTETFPETTELVGEAVLSLWLTCSTPDTAIHAYLEEILADGTARYITEGQLRARDRAVSRTPPSWADHLPWHSHERADAAPLEPGEPAELRLHLNPISYLLAAGSRLRLCLAGADRDNFVRVPESGVPTWTVLLGGPQASTLTLPLAEGT